eukprot:TRINITY_DN19279_c0_g2_i2.p1 TRINITY_DN19279_c0_g2~~TRINITY_DN19279_c0_g2_i2.p1  ORF type:complete len:127 (-),score=23.65 TRINITY_DN19279_c0_g2_i2:792-1172(-)
MSDVGVDGGLFRLVNEWSATHARRWVRQLENDAIWSVGDLEDRARSSRWESTLSRFDPRLAEVLRRWKRKRQLLGEPFQAGKAGQQEEDKDGRPGQEDKAVQQEEAKDSEPVQQEQCEDSQGGNFR